jgi:hypothetical protein
MTALEQYARLEAIARYRGETATSTREVVISFGERTLIIVGMDDIPIAHWPLASLDVEHQDDGSLEIAAFEGGAERLFLSDPDMIEAIDVVAPQPLPPPVEVPPPKRRWAWLTVLAFAGAIVYFLVVPLFSGRVMDLVPVERERAIGLAMHSQFLQGLELGEAGVCEEPDSLGALQALIERASSTLTPPPDITLTVVDHPSTFALALPGDQLIVFRGLIAAANTPEELAGLIAHEIHHVVSRDPLRKILDAASVKESLHHIGGDILGEPVPETALEVLLNQPYLPEVEAAADSHADATLRAAEVPPAKYGLLLRRIANPATAPPPGPDYAAAHPDLAGRAERFSDLESAEPAEFTPILPDRDWLVLQNICSGL